MSLLDKATQVAGQHQLSELQQQQAADIKFRDDMLKDIENRTGFKPLYAGVREQERPTTSRDRWGVRQTRWVLYREYVFDVDGTRLVMSYGHTWRIEIPCHRGCGHQALVNVSAGYGSDGTPEERQQKFVEAIAKQLARKDVRNLGECEWCCASVPDFCDSCGRGNR